ncbi:hypothetical protein ACN60_18140 [Escherichia coli]|nr:hypothetical protein ACN57_11520 [Escherichia coli]OKT42673.1 hypothetical protein ACN60_18140 [Escherichia coli]
MRRLRRIRQRCRLPDATLARLIRPTNSRTSVGRIRRLRRIRQRADCLMRRLRVLSGRLSSV